MHVGGSVRIWTAETVVGVAQRYPHLDLTPWKL